MAPRRLEDRIEINCAYLGWPLCPGHTGYTCTIALALRTPSCCDSPIVPEPTATPGAYRPTQLPWSEKAAGVS